MGSQTQQCEDACANIAVMQQMRVLTLVILTPSCKGLHAGSMLLPVWETEQSDFTIIALLH